MLTASEPVGSVFGWPPRTLNSVMSMKSVPEQPVGHSAANWRSGLIIWSRTNFTALPVVPVGFRRLSRPMLSSVNPAEPRPSTAIWNVVPLAEVSTVYSRVVAEAPSPQVAEGSIRKPETSIASGSSTTTVGGPASGFPGSSLLGL